MEKKELVTRIDEVRMRVEEPKNMVGKQLAEAVTRKWTEDFVDQDTGEVCSVERSELVIRNHKILTKEDVARIQSHQQTGEIKDVLVTNQDRPYNYVKSGFMFEVVIKTIKGGVRRLLIQAQGVNMALAIASDWGEQMAGDDFYITTIKVADDLRIVQMAPAEEDNDTRSYHMVTIEYYDDLDKNISKKTFLALCKDANQAIDIVRSVINSDDKLMELFGDYKISVVKQSQITDIVPVEMSKAYARYAKTHGIRVGCDALSL